MATMRESQEAEKEFDPRILPGIVEETEFWIDFFEDAPELEKIPRRKKNSEK